MIENSTPTRRTKRKALVVLVSLAVVVAGAGAAFAYWTTGGTGTGSAGTGTTIANVTVDQTSTVTDLHPGGGAQILSGSVVNNGDGPAYVRTITASIGPIDSLDAAATPACTAGDYTLINKVMTINAEFPVGTTPNAWGIASDTRIKFNNTAFNQDACKGATVHLVYTVS